MKWQPGFISIQDAQNIDTFLRRARFGSAYDSIDEQGKVGSALVEGEDLGDEDPEWPPVIGEVETNSILVVSDSGDMDIIIQTVAAIEDAIEGVSVMEYKLYYDKSAEHPVPYGTYIIDLSYPLKYEADHVVVKFNAEDVYGDHMGDIRKD